MNAPPSPFRSRPLPERPAPCLRCRLALAAVLAAVTDVVRELAHAPEAVDAVVGDVDRHPLRFEAAAHAVGEAHLVVDQQHPHGSILARMR